MCLTWSRTNVGDRLAIADQPLSSKLCIGGSRAEQVFLSKEESGSFNCATAGIQMWSHLGLGLGASRGPQAASLDQVGSRTWRAESRLLPFPEIQPSGKFFLKAATVVPEILFPPR